MRFALLIPSAFLLLAACAHEEPPAQNIVEPRVSSEPYRAPTPAPAPKVTAVQLPPPKVTLPAPPATQPSKPVAAPKPKAPPRETAAREVPVEGRDQKKEKVPLSDAEIVALLMKRSLAGYSGNCPCPYNVAVNGSKCGRRSAYSKPGGASPLCYPHDVTPQMIEAFRAQRI